jgi:hypothetical protein
MSSRRPFSKNTEVDYNAYYRRKAGLVNYQYARLNTSTNNNNINPNFLMNECPSTTPKCKSKKIYNYTSYETLINLSKIASSLNPDCRECADVPSDLLNGLQSELCYKEIYEPKCTRLESDNRWCGCARCLKIPIINNCSEKTGKLFPYARFNNSNKSPAIEIHSLKNISCECVEKLECPEYILCQCSPLVQNCECCKYTTTMPFDDKTNVSYIDNSRQTCADAVDPIFSKLPPDQLAIIQEMKHKKLVEDKQLNEKAFNVYSKFGAPVGREIK